MGGSTPKAAVILFTYSNRHTLQPQNEQHRSNGGSCKSQSTPALHTLTTHSPKAQHSKAHRYSLSSPPRIILNIHRLKILPVYHPDRKKVPSPLSVGGQSCDTSTWPMKGIDSRQHWTARAARPAESTTWPIKISHTRFDSHNHEMFQNGVGFL